MIKSKSDRTFKEVEVSVVKLDRNERKLYSQLLKQRVDDGR